MKRLTYPWIMPCLSPALSIAKTTMAKDSSRYHMKGSGNRMSSSSAFLFCPARTDSPFWPRMIVDRSPCALYSKYSLYLHLGSPLQSPRPKHSSTCFLWATGRADHTALAIAHSLGSPPTAPSFQFKGSLYLVAPGWTCLTIILSVIFWSPSSNHHRLTKPSDPSAKLFFVG